jgi:L-lactate dehydrogenase complex protein LldG
VVEESMTTRELILSRVRAALVDVPAAEDPEDVVVPREYLRALDVDVVELFVERISEYKTTVRRVSRSDVSQTIEEQLSSRGLRRIVAPPDVPDEWRPAGTHFVTGTLDAPTLDRADGALTGCALAIAETGTIVLDCGARQGGRALSLIPDYHLCIVRERQIVGTVPEAVALIAPTIRRMLRPVTFVSGPSATSDIELSRVEGVHGPRTLDVLVLREA